ncbi:MAG: helix-turn-helix domain-containing protein, partial [Firmicutes bacterium]|nr:helix-turn-helix domain-containing protein [Bacillota bacterium]
MDFAERLKELRAAAGLSQEKLAERLGVSRQVITKWETGRGTPDMENLIALAGVFSVSLDELIAGAGQKQPETDHLFESVTEYDIGDSKRFDIKLGRARSVEVAGYDGEKIRIRLASDAIDTLQSDFKIKVEDIRGRLDVELNRRRGVAE